MTGEAIPAMDRETASARVTIIGIGEIRHGAVTTLKQVAEEDQGNPQAIGLINRHKTVAHREFSPPWPRG